jgi:putative aldouronate transport system permease protein
MGRESSVLPALNKAGGLKRIGVFYPYWKHRNLMILMLPGMLYYAIFHYGPMYGAIIAFKDYQLLEGVFASPWVGLDNFTRLFDNDSFLEAFRNTLLISLYKLIFGFPAPIVFALLLNEIRLVLFKQLVQTITYMPHFVSWVILAGMMIPFLSPSIGPVNAVLKYAGLDPIYFLADTHWFRTVLVVSDTWKDLGWGSIIYFASLAGINRELYESADVDGANRFKKMWHITLPGIFPAIVIMFIFAVGKLIQDDFDQVFNLYNPAVYEVGDVVSTYVYRVGLVGLDYSLAAAVGLFKNVIALFMVAGANWLTKRFSEYSLW